MLRAHPATADPVPRVDLDPLDRHRVRHAPRPPSWRRGCRVGACHRSIACRPAGSRHRSAPSAGAGGVPRWESRRSGNESTSARQGLPPSKPADAVEINSSRLGFAGSPMEVTIRLWAMGWALTKPLPPVSSTRVIRASASRRSAAAREAPNRAPGCDPGRRAVRVRPGQVDRAKFLRVALVDPARHREVAVHPDVDAPAEDPAPEGTADDDEGLLVLPEDRVQ